jgi:ubiquinone/menaquinone biosynthesis C-methylase UbiE
METRHQDGEHDWHSTAYVDRWIAKDHEREVKRRPLLAKMMALAPFKSTDAPRVLDVAGGYGAVSEAVLTALPNAKLTIHDYSSVMLERAQKHFAHGSGPVAYVQGDLTDPTWTQRVGGPFDLIVSGIAIHNLDDLKLIARCYRDIYGLLVPGGVFLNCDHFGRAGGFDAHLEALKSVGFRNVACPWQEHLSGISTATR